MSKLLYFVTEDWYFCSHRLSLAKAAIEAGFEVSVLTNVQQHEDMIRSAGIKLIPIDLQRRSLNPLRELKTLMQIVNIYRDEQPDLVHHVAMKPVLYGSIAASLVGTRRVVNALAGMGYLFISTSLKARLLRLLVKRLFRFFLNRRGSCLILQNPDDADMFVTHEIVGENVVRLIRGSGVNVDEFTPSVESPEPVMIVLPARMLLDKGVVEFVESARILRRSGCTARFVLVGKCDPANPAAISAEQLELWQREQVVEWWGHRSDMVEVFSQAHIVCLPSYREGLPKALLEAASSGLPIVATDVPGCREIVRNGFNGFLVPPQDAENLSEALRELIDRKLLREEMGYRGREMVLKEFSEEIVIAETLKVYRESLS